MRPVTDPQWQDAVDAAQLLTMLALGQLFELISGLPEIDTQKCSEILEDGRARGITPRLNGEQTSALTLAEVERQHILRVLQKEGCIQARAAAALGISSSTLYRRLRDYKIAEGSKGKGAIERRDLLCFECEERGHGAADCPTLSHARTRRRTAHAHS